MSTTYNDSIKRHAKAMLANLLLREKMLSEGSNIPGNAEDFERELEVYVSSPVTTGKLRKLYADFDRKFSDFRPQSVSVDWFVDFTTHLKELVATCELGDSSVLMKIEAFVVFSYFVVRSRGVMDITMALSSLVHQLFGTSVSEKISHLVLNKFHEFIGEDRNQFHAQSLDEYLDHVCDGLDFTRSLAEVPVLKKFHKFFMYVLSFSLTDSVGLDFDALGYSHFEKEAIRKAHCSKVGFWYTLLDTLLLFSRQFVQSVRIGSFEPMLHTTGTYDKWLSAVMLLKRQEKFLSFPEPHDFDIFSFRANLDDALEKGRQIIKFNSGDSWEKKRIKGLLADLEQIKSDDISRRSAQRDRDAPFSILLSGGSSVGKSHLTNMLFQYFARLFDLPSGSEFKYTRNFTEEFWNGFNSAQWFVILDDIASLSPNLGSLDPSLAEVINVVNNVAFVPNQADLADKGRTPCLAQLVVATTNTPDLNAHAYFSCPLAIQRRIPWVVSIAPKFEYSRNEVMLDPSKCVADPERFDDYWVIRVDKIVPANNSAIKQRARTELVQTFSSIDLFLQWFGQTATLHRDQQRRLAQAERDMKNIEVCKNFNCLLPKYACTCYSEQSADIYTDEYDSWWWYEVFWSLLATMCFLPLWCYYKSLQRYMTRRFEEFVFDAQERLIRYAIHRMGQRMEQRLSPFKNHAKVLALGVGILGMCKLATFFNYPTNKKELPQEQSSTSISEIGVKPQPKENERVNVWYKEDFNVTSFDVSPTTSSWKALDKQVVEGKLQRNLLQFRLKHGEGHWRLTGALAVGSHLFAINAHALPEQIPFELIMCRNSEEGVNSNITVVVTESQVLRFTGTDIAFLYILNVPPYKDISPIFVTETLSGKYTGAYYGLSRDLKYTCNPVYNIVQDSYAWYKEKPTPHWRGVSENLTKDGDCGGVLLAFTPQGPVIFGIHALGNMSKEVVAAPIYRSMVDRAIMHFKCWRIQSGEPLINLKGDTSNIISSLDPKSPFRFIEKGNALVHGSLNGFKKYPKSRVRRTLMADFFESHGYKQKFDKPVMKGWLPWRVAALDMVNIPTGFDQGILNKCVDAFYNDIHKAIGHKFCEVEIYDLFTSINGAAGVAYVDKMNRNTSAGFPWNRSKKYYLNPVEPIGELLDPVDIDEDIKERVQTCLDTYFEGRRYMPVFTGHLKDEPTKYDKIERGKTRVFGGAPFDWSLVVRMYLLSVIRLIQNNKYVFESAPGTIAQSREWGDIFRYLTSFGKDRIVAGDYKAFDKSMPPNIILGAYDIIRRICATAGYSDESLRVVEGIAVDTAYPLFNFNGDLVTFMGSNPSGHPLTVIINGLANALYMRYCYYLLNPDHELESFKDHVHLMTYGDDNVMGVHPNASWFNHTDIQTILESHNVIYTMADKESKSIPYIHIHDVSFLKRYWRWNDEVQDYLCPLEHDSIEKSLMTCVESKSVTDKYQAVAIMSTACQEYFFYGKEVFEDKRALMLHASRELDLEKYLQDSTFPTWTELVERFLSYKCDLYYS